MKTKYLVMFFLFFGYLSCKQAPQKVSLSYLHTSGYDMVNEAGEKIYLKGVGLGNWLLPEGYMWKFGPEGDRPRKIEKVISDLIGEEKSKLFWTEFRKNYITEADIQRIAELGFNSVRPALNSRLFLSEGENPVYLDEGFQLMDSLIDWCKKYKLYVIIDMHGAPGGQTGANIDDSPKDLPELFMEQKYQDQLVNLWVKIAERYKDEPVIAAYDLLNEPLPVGTGSAEKYKHLLVPLYERLIREIRKIDQKHMFTIEGYDWAGNWSLFNKPLDQNIFYQFHYYCWAKPDNLGNIDYYLKKRDTLNTPIWVGETGEKGNTIYWGTAQYFETNNIGFSFWPWKKMDTKNTPYSINKPANWDLISAYTSGGEKPDSILAEKALNELLQNIKLKNCAFFEDVTNSIFNRIPGKIEAENYAHTGYNQSYFVKDTAKRSEFYRTNEPVQVKLFKKDEDSHISEQFVELNESEWVLYQFNSLDSGKSQLTVKVSAEQVPATLIIEINDEKTEVQLDKTEWTEINVGEFNLKQGKNQLKLFAKSKKIMNDWMSFN